MMHTVSDISEGFYKEKGSRFIALVHPVKDTEEINEILEGLRKSYHDARHFCYAWVLGKTGETYRANDDGEPAHSAGDPILGQIRAAELTQVLVVVIRYFGGTKLGVGGLVQAYKAAAKDAIDKATLIPFEIRKVIKIIYPYEDTAFIERLCSASDVTIVKKDFSENCYTTISLPEDWVTPFTQRLEEAQQKGASIQWEHLS